MIAVRSMQTAIEAKASNKFKEREVGKFKKVTDFQNLYLSGLLTAAKNITNPKIDDVTQNFLDFMKSEDRLLDESVKKTS